MDPIRTRRVGSNRKGLDVGSCESEKSDGFLRQFVSMKEEKEKRKKNPRS